MTATPPSGGPVPGRRAVLAALAAGAAGACARPALPPQGADREHPDPKAAPRPAARRPGVDDPPPRHALVAAYDLAEGLRNRAGAAHLRRALMAWLGIRLPGGATLTLAAGPGLLPALGLPAPAALRAVPPFPGERLDARRGGGDVLVQLCADDPDALGRAADRLGPLAVGALRPRWSERGFLPGHTPGETPRNLFGFKDGTENPAHGELGRWVWNPDDSTYLVYRRIHMNVPDFTALPLGRQEQVIGRRRATGAPLTGHHEHDTVDLYAKTPEGRYVIPADAHVRVAHSRLDGGARMLRRGYSYDNGPGDRGLLFLAYMRDPALFTRVQQRLSESDAMRAFIEHRASAVGYVLPADHPLVRA
ncbi:Dyp-type peroxidase [Streptomyces melanogenes]|uniref:Dyp-type peroxidase n=1 Tax=Streptomyces melanogenes TaxID=67326 RepID=UPI001995D700|nr:Dyp-type peroxidase [Streptomyces melanogenes]GGP89514.1 hypothetical protein GCM10010278_80010 [Streptomyces melanogenes]